MSDAPGLDEREHDTVLRPLLSEALNGHIYGYGEVPGGDGKDGELPDIYGLLSLQRRFDAAPRKSGRSGRSGWRISVRCVGTTVDEVRWARLQVATAIEGLRITVDDVESTPISHERSTAIAPDDGRQSGLVEFTFAL